MYDYIQVPQNRCLGAELREKRGSCHHSPSNKPFYRDTNEDDRGGPRSFHVARNGKLTCVPNASSSSLEKNASLQTYPLRSSAIRRNHVRGPWWVALVRIHAGHAVLCPLLSRGCGHAVAQAQHMSVHSAKVASPSAQHFGDTGSK